MREISINKEGEQGMGPVAAPYEYKIGPKYSDLLHRFMDVMDRVMELNNKYADLIPDDKLLKLNMHADDFKNYAQMVLDHDIGWDDDSVSARFVDLFIHYDYNKYGSKLPPALTKKIKPWRNVANSLISKLDQESYKIAPRTLEERRIAFGY